MGWAPFLDPQEQDGGQRGFRVDHKGQSVRGEKGAGRPSGAATQCPREGTKSWNIGLGSWAAHREAAAGGWGGGGGRPGYWGDRDLRARPGERWGLRKSGDRGWTRPGWQATGAGRGQGGAAWGLGSRGQGKGHGAAGEGEEEEEERGAVGLAGSDFLHLVRLPSQQRALPGSQRPRTAAFLGQPPRQLKGPSPEPCPPDPADVTGYEKSNSTDSFYFSSWILPAAHGKRRQQPPAFGKRGQETFSVRSGKGCQAGAAVLAVLLGAVPTPRPRVPALGLTSGS